jgi:hypothetical protein
MEYHLQFISNEVRTISSHFQNYTFEYEIIFKKRTSQNVTTHTTNSFVNYTVEII